MDRERQDPGRAAPLLARVSPARRASTLLAVIALHAALLIALLRGGSALPGSHFGTLTVFSLAPPSNAASKPVEAVKPEKPRPRTKEGERKAPDAALAAAMPSTKGEVCEPLEAVSLALSGDEPARAALDALPSEAIGLANSIAVWALDWNEAASPPSGPLLPVRAAVESALLTLPQACLETPVAGPVILPVTTTRRTSVLVFGSGRWSWAQLIAEPFDAAAPLGPDRKMSIIEEIFDGL